MAIDASVSAAVKIVWRERLRRCGCGRNVRVEVTIVGASPRDAGVIKGMARVWTEVAAPIVRPFPAVPRVESVSVFGMRDTSPPVVINVNVI